MNSDIMAHSSEHSIEQLFSVFSHELRTPITCLQGAIELLQTYQRTHPQSNPTELQNLLTLAAESTD
ncbi:MAG TPA: histidine kinase dimerization/phospho-acceptor domain-containing protein, partial [Cyanophyceae cyanobacterium]